ncbi:MAG: hypothetical protein Tsb0027_03110 [Wenzhouxiangellaceae bacterium]
MDWATPQEIKFWSSILLCEDADGPRVLLYPHFNTYVLDSGDIDLRQPEHQEALSRLLEAAAAEPEGLRWGGSLRSCARGGYHLIFDDFNGSRQRAFHAAIGVRDHCFLRGMACLIKCDMLSQHYQFGEEAGLVAFIALEASYSLVIEKLKAEGKRELRSDLVYDLT